MHHKRSGVQYADLVEVLHRGQTVFFLELHGLTLSLSHMDLKKGVRLIGHPSSLPQGFLAARVRRMAKKPGTNQGGLPLPLVNESEGFGHVLVRFRDTRGGQIYDPLP